MQVDVLTLAVSTCVTGAVGWGVKALLDSFKAYVGESKAWRESVDAKLSDMEGKLDRSISTQAAQIRSDIVHKCHRYLDDLGRASTEEKKALHDEHVQYAEFCDDLGIDNNFIDELVSRVMALPEREI